MQLTKITSLALLVLVPSTAFAQVGPGNRDSGASDSDVIDFESLPAGTVLTEVFGAFGSGPIKVTGFNPALGPVEAALIFNSAAPTGGDFDLGTPNQDFGGPGIGDGGDEGSPYENTIPQGNILILAENLVDSDGDGLVDDPDDADSVGGSMSFDFSAIGTVRIDGIYLIDVEADEPNAIVDLYDDRGTLIQTATLPATGDNGAVRWTFGGIEGVQRVDIFLNGSGGIDELIYTPENGCEGIIGDYVWKDANCDGLQGPDEEGLTGVTVWLKDEQGVVLESTVTNFDGLYTFDDLCAGTYIVEVDSSTLPPFCIPAPCNVGGDDSIDNDCSPVVVILPENSTVDLTIDFGYCDENNGRGEGCTPGYWKQPQHFDSWPSGLLPDTLFSDVFEDAFPGMTLLQVLEQGGGHIYALGRHTVAALLNAEKSEVDYGIDGDMVIELFNDVFPGTIFEYEALKDFFAGMNEEGCPLN